MLASKLIEELQNIIAENGDVEIHIVPDENNGNFDPIKSLKIERSYYANSPEFWTIR